MKKDRVLKRIVLLQAVCLILLALVFVYRVLIPPKAAPQLPSRDIQDLNDAQAADPNSIAAKVGGQPITVGELNEQLRLQYGDSVLHTLMVRAAIRLESDAYGLQVTSAELDWKLAAMMDGYENEEQYYAAMKEQLGMTPEEVREDARYRLLLEKIAVRIANVSEAEINTYIDDHEAEFSARTQLRISWIVSDTKKAAQEVLQKLADGQDFALMAKTYSVDADTAADGGDLGYIDEDDPIVDQRMLKAAKKLNVGETAGPISVDNGQAVIRLIERQRDKQLDRGQQRDKARTEVAVDKLNGERAIQDNLLAKYQAVVIPQHR